MRPISRRQLSKYAAKQLLSGAKASDLAKVLAAELLRTKRVKDLPLLIKDIAAELEAGKTLAYVEVSSARPLSSETLKQLQSFAKDELQVASVELSIDVKPELIGGVQLRSARRQLDSSVRRSLEQLCIAIKQEPIEAK